jgi:hypothetical protein
MTTPAPPPRAKDASKHRARSGTPEPGEKSPGHVVFFLVTVAALIVGGWYLIDGMSQNSRLEDCTMAGRRNCVPPIDTSKFGR